MKLLPIALVLAGTTGLAGLAFAAGQTVTVHDLAMPGAAMARDGLSSLRLADFSHDDDDDDDEAEGEDDDDEGSDDDDDDDDSAAPFAPVICLTGNVDGDDEDEDEGVPVCDPAGQALTGPAAVTPDPNRAPIFNSAPTAVVN